MARPRLEDQEWPGWWIAAAAVERWRRAGFRWATSWGRCAAELRAGRADVPFPIETSPSQLREWYRRRRACIRDRIIPACFCDSDGKADVSRHFPPELRNMVDPEAVR